MDDIKRFVRAKYDERVRMRTDLPSEFLRSLNSHERVPMMIDNLAASLYRSTKKFKDLKLETITMAVYDMTDLFLSNCMRHAHERGMSDLEKQRIRDEEAKKQALAAEADALIEGTDEQVTTDRRGNETSRQVIKIH